MKPLNSKDLERLENTSVASISMASEADGSTPEICTECTVFSNNEILTLCRESLCGTGVSGEPTTGETCDRVGTTLASLLRSALA